MTEKFPIELDTYITLKSYCILWYNLQVLIRRLLKICGKYVLALNLYHSKLYCDWQIDHIDQQCLKAWKFLTSPKANQRNYTVKKIIVTIMFIVIDIVVTYTI